jgi:hypothetical protein
VTVLMNRWFAMVLIAVVSLALAGCEAIGAVFKTGVWAGAIMIVLILAVVGFIAAKIRG